MTLSDELIPIAHFQEGFTTCAALLQTHPNLTLEKLEDKVLGVHKNASKTPHTLSAPPESGSPSPPESAWLANYPKGSINPTAPIPGGMGFYMSGPASFAARLGRGVTEALFSYRMMMQNDWEWNKGGKLPGVFGGEGDLAYTCTGGRQNDRCKCFNLRLMWRTNGKGEMYAYVPPCEINDERLISVPPVSKKNADYGFSVGQGSFDLNQAKGKWLNVAFRVKLNAVENLTCPDGEIQLWINGVSMINVSGLLLRDSEEGKMKGFHFQTFFGGHTDEWACPKDLQAWFADISGVIIQ